MFYSTINFSTSVVIFCLLITTGQSYLIESNQNNINWLIRRSLGGNQKNNLLNNVDFENLTTLDISGRNDDLESLLNDDKQQYSCQLVKIIHLLHYPGCQSKAISSFACSGLCPSYVQLSSSKFWQHERSCSCCQQTGLQEATFTLDCPSLEPPYRRVKTYAPVECLCRACTDLGKDKIQPQELVEALNGEFKNTDGKV